MAPSLHTLHDQTGVKKSIKEVFYSRHVIHYCKAVYMQVNDFHNRMILTCSLSPLVNYSRYDIEHRQISSKWLHHLSLLKWLIYIVSLSNGVIFLQVTLLGHSVFAKFTLLPIITNLQS